MKILRSPRSPSFAHAAGGIGTGSSSPSLPHTELAGIPLAPFFVGVPSPLASR